MSARVVSMRSRRISLLHCRHALRKLFSAVTEAGQKGEHVKGGSPGRYSRSVQSMAGPRPEKRVCGGVRKPKFDGSVFAFLKVVCGTGGERNRALGGHGLTSHVWV